MTKQRLKELRILQAFQSGDVAEGMLELINELEAIQKEYFEYQNFQEMNNRVSGNISAIKEIHEKSLRAIKSIVDQAFCAHPEYPESYPKILAHIEKEIWTQQS